MIAVIKNIPTSLVCIQGRGGRQDLAAGVNKLDIPDVSTWTNRPDVVLVRVIGGLAWFTDNGVDPNDVSRIGRPYSDTSGDLLMSPEDARSLKIMAEDAVAVFVTYYYAR